MSDTGSVDEGGVIYRPIQSFTGKKIDPFNIVPDDICFIDIAHGLSRVCRFGGHVVGFLSVAEHSIRVAERVKKVRPDLTLKALLHDAAEAYIGDMPSPMKHRPEMEFYRELEDGVEAAIWEHFGWRYPMTKRDYTVIKNADIAETTADCTTWRYSPSPFDTPDDAKLAFIRYWTDNGGLELE